MAHDGVVELHGGPMKSSRKHHRGAFDARWKCYAGVMTAPCLGHGEAMEALWKLHAR